MVKAPPRRVFAATASWNQRSAPATSQPFRPQSRSQLDHNSVTTTRRLNHNCTNNYQGLQPCRAYFRTSPPTGSRLDHNCITTASRPQPQPQLGHTPAQPRSASAATAPIARQVRSRAEPTLGAPQRLAQSHPTASPRLRHDHVTTAPGPPAPPPTATTSRARSRVLSTLCVRGMCATSQPPPRRNAPARL